MARGPGNIGSLDRVGRFVRQGTGAKGQTWQKSKLVGLGFFVETPDTKVLLDGMTKANSNKKGLQLTFENMWMLMGYWLGREVLRITFATINQMNAGTEQLAPNKELTLMTRRKHKKGPPLKHTEQLMKSLRFYVSKKEMTLGIVAEGQRQVATGDNGGASMTKEMSNFTLLKILEAGYSCMVTTKMHLYFLAKANEARDKAAGGGRPSDLIGWERLAAVKIGATITVPPRPVLRPAAEVALKQLQQAISENSQWAEVLKTFVLTGEAPNVQGVA